MNKEKSTEELLKLMQENPELSVIPMVDSDIINKEWLSWHIGRLESPEIDEYLVADGIIYTKTSDDLYDVLEAVYGEFRVSKMTEEEAAEAYQQLPWIKAIMLYVRAIWV